MNEGKLTAQQVMQETGWTFCKDNEEATRKETEAAVDYVLITSGWTRRNGLKNKRTSVNLVCTEQR